MSDEPVFVALERQLGRVIVPGENLRLRGVHLYRCPVCANEFRYDDEYEPICTGPHPSLDEHAPAIMARVGEEAARLQVVMPGR